MRSPLLVVRNFLSFATFIFIYRAASEPQQRESTSYRCLLLRCLAKNGFRGCFPFNNSREERSRKREKEVRRRESDSRCGRKVSKSQYKEERVTERERGGERGEGKRTDISVPREDEASLYFSCTVVPPLGALVVHQNGMKTPASF